MSKEAIAEANSFMDEVRSAMEEYTNTRTNLEGMSGRLGATIEELVALKSDLDSLLNGEAQVGGPTPKAAPTKERPTPVETVEDDSPPEEEETQEEEVVKPQPKQTKASKSTNTRSRRQPEVKKEEESSDELLFDEDDSTSEADDIDDIPF